MARVFHSEKDIFAVARLAVILESKKMRLLLILLALLSFTPAFAQEVESRNQYAIQLTLNERYRDTLNWDSRIIQAVEAYELLLKKWEAEGKLVLAGSIALPPRAPEQFELLVLQPMSMEEARGILQQLPVVRSGMMRARLFPFTLKTALPLSAKDKN